MPEGSTSTYNPETGETRVTPFTYTPSVPREPQLDVAAVQQTLQSEKADEALKRIQAAQYFLGSRLLKKALDENDSKGAMRATLMMFPKNPQVGPALFKALTPPAMTPDQAVRNALAREKFEFEKTQPKTLHVGNAAYQRDPITGEYRQVVAPPPASETVTEKIPEAVATPAVAASPAKGPSLFHWWGQPAVQAQPAVPAHGEYTVRHKVSPGWAPGMPFEAASAVTNAAPVPATSASPRVLRANELARQNPSWTRQQIIEAVRKEFK